MGKVLEMPRKQSTKRARVSLSTSHQPEAEEDRSLFLSLLEEDNFFIELIKEWPCFSSLKYNIKASELFNKYCKNKLNPSQECTIDFMLHIHDSSFVFDVNCSLTIWDKSDRDFFFYFLEQHAEVLNQ